MLKITSLKSTKKRKLKSEICGSMSRVKHIPRPGKHTRCSGSNGKFQSRKPSFSQFHIFLSQLIHFSANESEEKKKRR